MTEDIIVNELIWEFFERPQEHDEAVAEEVKSVTTKDGRNLNVSTKEVSVLYEALLHMHKIEDEGHEKFSTKRYTEVSERIDVDALLEKVMKLANLN